MKLLTASILFLFSTNALAVTLVLGDLPVNTGTGFQHNNFHDTTLDFGRDGVKLGWFTLGAGGGTWDTDTGDFVMNIDIFSDDTLTTPAGTAVGSGNLDIFEMNYFDGGLIGSINWDFDATAEANGFTDIQTSFYDVYYGKSSALNPFLAPNYFHTPFLSLTLWGSDGDLDPISGIYEGNGIAPTMGADFVALFQPIPVPAAVWLFGSGLLALVGISRRVEKHG